VTPGAAQRGRPGVTVELVGIPGAGKSSLAQALVADLAGRGVAVLEAQAALGPSVPVVRRLARKTVACAATALASPGTTVRVAGGVARSGQPGPGDVAGRLVQWLVAQHGTARARRRDGVSILDEGVLQSLWSVGLRGDVTPLLTALDGSRGAASADLLVVVEVPPGTAQARLVARASQHSRTQLLAEDDRLAELERGAELLDRLVGWWSAGAPAGRQVAVVSGADDSGAARRALVDRVLAVLPAG
jgi:hypothetical protein